MVQVTGTIIPMVGTTMVGHIHIMIIELLMKFDIILKIVGCTVTKMLDQNKGTFSEVLFLCPF